MGAKCSKSDTECQSSLSQAQASFNTCKAALAKAQVDMTDLTYLLNMYRYRALIDQGKIYHGDEYIYNAQEEMKRKDPTLKLDQVPPKAFLLSTQEAFTGLKREDFTARMLSNHKELFGPEFFKSAIVSDGKAVIHESQPEALLMPDQIAFVKMIAKSPVSATGAQVSATAKKWIILAAILVAAAGIGLGVGLFLYKRK